MFRDSKGAHFTDDPSEQTDMLLRVIVYDVELVGELLKLSIFISNLIPATIVHGIVVVTYDCFVLWPKDKNFF